MVWFFSDNLRILAGNPVDLSVDFYGIPAVDGGGNVAKRVASFRAAGITYCVPFPVRTFTLPFSMERMTTAISTGFGSFKASSATKSDLCVLEP